MRNNSFPQLIHNNNLIKKFKKWRTKHKKKVNRIAIITSAATAILRLFLPTQLYGLFK
ncbi:hypothetical protein ACFL1M_01140 [Patescibacteria group bacterium]